MLAVRVNGRCTATNALWLLRAVRCCAVARCAVLCCAVLCCVVLLRALLFSLVAARSLARRHSSLVCVSLDFFAVWCHLYTSALFQQTIPMPFRRDCLTLPAAVNHGTHRGTPRGNLHGGGHRGGLVFVGTGGALFLRCPHAARGSRRCLLSASSVGLSACLSVVLLHAN
ncbi:unnamed protein product [Laminaria digitata]